MALLNHNESTLKMFGDALWCILLYVMCSVIWYNAVQTINSQRNSENIMIDLAVATMPAYDLLPPLTHRGREKMADIFQTTFSHAFS